MDQSNQSNQSNHPNGWNPTHELHVGGEVFPVMLFPTDKEATAIYTEADWKAEMGEWTVEPDALGRQVVFFSGDPTDGYLDLLHASTR